MSMVPERSRRTELDIKKEGVIGFEWSMVQKAFFTQVAAVSDECSIETNILTGLNYLLQIRRASSN